MMIVLQHSRAEFVVVGVSAFQIDQALGSVDETLTSAEKPPMTMLVQRPARSRWASKRSRLIRSEASES